MRNFGSGPATMERALICSNDRAPEHLVLHGVCERATQVRGKFEVWSELNSGTKSN
jgi:hypothetical protein